MDTSNLDFDKATALLEPAANFRGAVPRDILLVIDWEERQIYAETRDPGDRGMPERRWNGLESAYVLPQGVDATRLRGWVEEEVVPRAAPLADAFEAEWDDLRKVGRFPGHENDRVEFDAWMCIRAEPPQHSGGLWTVDEWLEDGIPEVRPDSSDEDLEILAEDLVREAESQDIVLVGGVQEVYNYLLSLRDSLREPDTFEITGYEVIEKVAKASGTSARVWVPKTWVGKRVKIVRLDP